MDKIKLALAAGAFITLAGAAVAWAVGGFTDTAGHEHTAEIGLAESKGLFRGYGDGTFQPDKTLTNAQSERVLRRMLDRYTDDDGNSTLTRAQAAVLLVRGVCGLDGDCPPAPAAGPSARADDQPQDSNAPTPLQRCAAQLQSFFRGWQHVSVGYDSSRDPARHQVGRSPGKSTYIDLTATATGQGDGLQCTKTYLKVEDLLSVVERVKQVSTYETRYGRVHVRSCEISDRVYRSADAALFNAYVKAASAGSAPPAFGQLKLSGEERCSIGTLSRWYTADGIVLDPPALTPPPGPSKACGIFNRPISGTHVSFSPGLTYDLCADWRFIEFSRYSGHFAIDRGGAVTEHPARGVFKVEAETDGDPPETVRVGYRPSGGEWQWVTVVFHQGELP